MSHYHVVSQSIHYVVRDFTPSDFHRSATARECACESGELDLYCAAIEAGEIDEQCPCDSCQRDRNARFAQWKAQQEKAGIVL